MQSQSSRFFPVVLSVFLMLGLVAPLQVAAATPTLTAAESVANVTAGTTDQTDVTTATTANVVEVKATRTLSVNALPALTETITIGLCVVSFTPSTQDTDCSNNTASIATTTDTTASAIASRIRTFTSVSDTGHGALTITGATTNAIFTTTGTEASGTVITFTDGTTGDITSSSSTTGVVPVVQVNTITIAGTVDTGDVFTATLPTVGAVTYTVTSSDTTTANIATGLNAAIQASSGYASQAFTSSASTNTVVLTAKVAGTGFTQTSSTSNRAAVAQVVTFTPAIISSDYYYDILINSTRYSQKGQGTVKELVEGLVTSLAGATGVSCTENDVIVTCTASTAGTAFTYSAEIVILASGGGSSRARNSQPAALETTQNTLASLQAALVKLLAQAKAEGIVISVPTSAASYARDLTVGVMGEDVRKLQKYLNKTGFTISVSGPGSTGSETDMFGALTKAALVKFQEAKGIAPAAGYFGPKTRAYIEANP